MEVKGGGGQLGRGHDGAVASFERGSESLCYLRAWAGHLNVLSP